MRSKSSKSLLEGNVYRISSSVSIEYFHPTAQLIMPGVMSPANFLFKRKQKRNYITLAIVCSMVPI